MSEHHVEEEALHRYFDGELTAAEAATVRGHLASCSECSARHQSLTTLRQLITMAAEDSTLDVDFDRAYAHIERAIGAQAHAPGLFERAVGWLKTTLAQRPEQLWAPALGAAAAAALIVVLGRQTPDAEVAARLRPAPKVAVALGETGGAPAEPAAPAPAKAPALPAEALAMASSEVVQVDFGEHTGTVFEIAVADGVSTPVVWINDDLVE